MIAIIDLGTGNLRSVEKALHYLGYPAQVTTHSPTVLKAQAVILPGVGAFAKAMAALNRDGMAEAVRMTVNAGKPFMGICLGLQMLFESSEEFGQAAGLGILPGQVKRFSGPEFARDSGEGLKVPHIGWNSIRITKLHPVLAGIPDGAMFYFVHSYAAAPASQDYACAITEYGIPFVSAVAHGKLFACQFHPEKSGRAGLRMLANFGRMAYPEGPPEPSGPLAPKMRAREAEGI